MSTAAPSDSEKLPGPRSRKGLATRARLLDAAKAVFEEDGFLEARISDIAERAGLSHGSFYHYFDSKEQIFRVIAKGLDDRLNAPLHMVILDPSSTATLRQRVREANRRYLESYRAEAKIIGVIEQVSRYDEHVNAVRFESQRRTCDQVAEAIRQLQRRGLADPDLDPLVTAPALGAMIARFAELWLVQNFLDYRLEDGVEQLTMLFANAVQLRDVPAPEAADPAEVLRID
ncbi:MAG: TetR/AcrR family transcriptional regulator [Frankia sp.]